MPHLFDLWGEIREKRLYFDISFIYCILNVYLIFTLTIFQLLNRRTFVAERAPPGVIDHNNWMFYIYPDNKIVRKQVDRDLCSYACRSIDKNSPIVKILRRSLYFQGYESASHLVFSQNPSPHIKVNPLWTFTSILVRSDKCPTIR